MAGDLKRSLIEQFNGSANQCGGNVRENGEPAKTFVEPVNANSVPRTQRGILRRLRRWTVKKLRSLFCIRIHRERSRSTEDDPYVKNRDNKENESLNNTATQKTKNEIRGNSNGVMASDSSSKNQSIIGNNAPFKQTTVSTLDADKEINDIGSLMTSNDATTREEPVVSKKQFLQSFWEKNTSVDNKSSQNMKNKNVRPVDGDNGINISSSISNVPPLRVREEHTQQQITVNGNSNDIKTGKSIGTDRRYRNMRNKNRNVMENTDKLFKYWRMRYDLFSKFEDGIMLDRESFYSVCPEAISQYIADGCAFDVGVDPFCGAGGNIIQLAMVCKSVIAIDIDPNKIKLAKHNAELYGVRDKIKFIVADFFAIAGKIKADVLVTSPPWGGPDYFRKREIPLADLCGDNGGGENIIHIAKSIAPRVVLHLPKNASVDDCIRFGMDFKSIAFENIFLNGKPNCLTVFFCLFPNWYDCGVFEDLEKNDSSKQRSHVPKISNTEVRLCSIRICRLYRNNIDYIKKMFHDIFRITLGDAVPYNGRGNNIEQFRKYMDSVQLFCDKVKYVPG